MGVGELRQTERTCKWQSALPLPESGEMELVFVLILLCQNHFGPVVKDGFHTVLTPNTGLLFSQETIHCTVNRRERGAKRRRMD